MCVVFESCPVPGTDAFSWGHDWKGVSKDKERKVPASFEFTQTKDVQVSSFGTLVGGVAAPVLRQFWKERQKSIIYNAVRDAVAAESEFRIGRYLSRCNQSCLVSYLGGAKSFRQVKGVHVDLCREETC